MKDADLDALLRSAAEPSRPEGYWEALPGRVLNRLSRSEERSAEAASPWWIWGASVMALAIVLISVAFFLGARARVSRQPDLYAALKNTRMVGEMLSFFPHQIRALVEDGSGVHLMLSDRADVPTSPPLWIEVDGHSSRRAFVTFSGQQVQIAGEPVEVLADPQGQITLVGDHLFWSSTAHSSLVAGLRIRAQALAAL